jgi:hypothetical protein
MFYGYIIFLIIIIHNNVYYNQLNKIKLEKINDNLIYKLNIKNTIFNDLKYQLDQTKSINNVLKVQLENNSMIPFVNDIVYLKK